ncbi:MAG: flagellar hook-basal body complex protein FliE [Pseudomonadota bacterium]
MEIRPTIAALQYKNARPATEPQTQQGGQSGGLPNFVTDFAATLKEGEDTAAATMAGDADPHALVQALAQSELAVETAVTVRDKVVEAYQEILRMPV